MKETAIILFTIGFTFGTWLVDVQDLRAFCKNGCNFYIKCSSSYFIPRDYKSLGSTRSFSETFEKRAVNGVGTDCNIFGCNCGECKLDGYTTSWEKLESWCAAQYSDDLDRRAFAKGHKDYYDVKWSVRAVE